MESLPFHVKPHDALRQGLASLKEDAAPKHPVEAIQREAKKQVRGAALWGQCCICLDDACFVGKP